MIKSTNATNVARDSLTPEEQQRLDLQLRDALTLYQPIDQIINLIELGADVNVANLCTQTALHRACLNNNPEFAAFLIAHGAYVDIQDFRGESPLHQACAYNRTELAAVVMQHGADINIKDCRGQTPLHKACLRYENFKVVKLLIDAGANIHITDNEGSTPLRLACEQSPGILAMYENYHAIVAPWLITDEIIIDFQIPKLLIQSGDDGRSLLFSACQKGDFVIARRLIEFGVEVDLSLLKAFVIEADHNLIDGVIDGPIMMDKSLFNREGVSIVISDYSGSSLIEHGLRQTLLDSIHVNIDLHLREDANIEILKDRQLLFPHRFENSVHFIDNEGNALIGSDGHHIGIHFAGEDHA